MPLLSESSKRLLVHNLHMYTYEKGIFIKSLCDDLKDGIISRCAAGRLFYIVIHFAGTSRSLGAELRGESRDLHD